MKTYVTKARRKDYKPTDADPSGVAWDSDEKHPGYNEYDGKELVKEKSPADEIREVNEHMMDLEVAYQRMKKNKPELTFKEFNEMREKQAKAKADKSAVKAKKKAKDAKLVKEIEDVAKEVAEGYKALKKHKDKIEETKEMMENRSPEEKAEDNKLWKEVGDMLNESHGKDHVSQQSSPEAEHIKKSQPSINKIAEDLYDNLDDDGIWEGIDDNLGQVTVSRAWLTETGKQVDEINETIKDYLYYSKMEAKQETPSPDLDIEGELQEHIAVWVVQFDWLYGTERVEFDTKEEALQYPGRVVEHYKNAFEISNVQLFNELRQVYKVNFEFEPTDSKPVQEEGTADF